MEQSIILITTYYYPLNGTNAPLEMKMDQFDIEEYWPDSTNEKATWRNHREEMFTDDKLKIYKKVNKIGNIVLYIAPCIDNKNAELPDLYIEDLYKKIRSEHQNIGFFYMVLHDKDLEQDGNGLVENLDFVDPTSKTKVIVFQHEKNKDIIHDEFISYINKQEITEQNMADMLEYLQKKEFHHII